MIVDDAIYIPSLETCQAMSLMSPVSETNRQFFFSITLRWNSTASEVRDFTQFDRAGMLTICGGSGVSLRASCFPFP